MDFPLDHIFGVPIGPRPHIAWPQLASWEQAIHHYFNEVVKFRPRKVDVRGFGSAVLDSGDGEIAYMEVVGERQGKQKVWFVALMEDGDDQDVLESFLSSHFKIESGVDASQAKELYERPVHHERSSKKRRRV
ncbi:MAG: hypothetical protein Q9159_003590 [Coniocarpon cinnabarinum]